MTATKRVGLSAVLKFVGDSAIAGMKQAGGEFNKLSFSAKQLKQGVADINAGLSKVATVGMVAGTAAGFTVKKFADFAGQMAAVRSVLQKEDKAGDFKRLSDQASHLGATTSFTAKQAAEAMENLARAGLRPAQIMSSIGPVLNAAAAEGMNLATAADIVAANMRAFHLNAKDAARIADTLAFVSANTNTNMVRLQEGMKFAAPIAKDLGISLQDTASGLGILADIGLKGSLAGTALKNALIKIAAGAKNNAVKVGKFRVEVARLSDGSVDLRRTMLGIAKALKNTSDPLKRNKAAMKLLGIRGVGTASAFAAVAGNTSRVNKLFGVLRRKELPGTAKRMAAMRLDSIQGDFVRLSSAVDGLTNAIGAAFAPTIRKLVGPLGKGGLTGVLGEAVAAFKHFSAMPQDLNQKAVPAIKGVKQSVAGAVRGFLRGFQDTKAMLERLGTTVKGVAGAFGFFTGKGTEGSVLLTTKLLGVSIAVAGVGAALKGASMLFGGFARVGVGAARITIAAFAPLGKMLGGIGATIGKKFPLLAQSAGKVPGALGKAFRGFEKITAQPVRVVNFDELALMQKLGGAGTTATTMAATAGVMTRFRGAINGAAGALPLLGGVLTTTLSRTALMSGGFLKVAGKLAGFTAAVAAAGYAGYKFGQWLDKTLKLSDRISGTLYGWLNDSANKKIVFENKQRTAYLQAEEGLKRRIKLFSEMGTLKTRTEAGKIVRVANTREFARQRAKVLLAKQGFTSEQIAQALTKLAPLLQRLPEKAAGDVNVQIKLDGKVVATAVAKTKKEAEERGAPKNPTRRVAAVGGSR